MIIGGVATNFLNLVTVLERMRAVCMRESVIVQFRSSKIDTLELDILHQVSVRSTKRKTEPP